MLMPLGPQKIHEVRIETLFGSAWWYQGGQRRKRNGWYLHWTTANGRSCLVVNSLWHVSATGKCSTTVRTAANRACDMIRYLSYRCTNVTPDIGTYKYYNPTTSTVVETNFRAEWCAKWRLTRVSLLFLVNATGMSSCNSISVWKHNRTNFHAYTNTTRVTK